MLQNPAAHALKAGRAFRPTHRPEHAQKVDLVYERLALGASAFIALTGVLTILAALAYPIAIVLPATDNAAQALAKLSLLIAAAISLLVLVIVWLAGDWVIPKLGAESLIDFKYLIPLVMFITACQDVSQQWLIRKKHFKAIANISIAHSIK